MFLRNVGIYVRVYTASKPLRNYVVRWMELAQDHVRVDIEPSYFTTIKAVTSKWVA
jgi:hypothetical protein